MKFLRLWIILVSIICLAKPVWAGFYSETTTLENGMDVIVIPNPKVPAVSHMVWYHVGSIDEKPGKSGLAHYLEHLMFKGTKNKKDSEFSSTVARLGGNDNAFTSKDFTAYYQNISKDHLNVVMEFESDRMRNLIFDEAAVLNERHVVLEERHQRVESNPGSRLHEAAINALYQNHTYSRPIIGWKHEIEQLTSNDTKAFYQQYYCPSNATLVISGDVTLSDILPDIKTYYGTIEKHASRNVRPVITEPTLGVNKALTLTDPTVTINEWSQYYLAPQYNAASPYESIALSLFSYLVGETEVSLLNKKLVLEQKIASSVGTYYDELTVGPSYFSVHIRPTPGTSLDTIATSYTNIMINELDSYLTEEKLQRAKKALIASSIFAQEDLKTLSFIYGKAAVVGAGTYYVENWANMISDITLEQVKDAGKQLLNHSSVTARLLKAGQS